jgi:hypothetical protein
MVDTELLNRIHKYNPFWEPFVLDYITGKAEALPSSHTDSLIPDTSQPHWLDMNLGRLCLVGEFFGFNYEYPTIEGDQCEECERYGQSLFEMSKTEATKDEFEEQLGYFYFHIESEHQDTIGMHSL